MNLKELRKKRNVTQAEVAKYLNITPQAYANYERGDRTPDIVTCKKLADFFGVSLEALLSDNIETELKPNQIITIGRDGKKEVYELDEKEKAVFDNLLEMYTKKK